MSKLNNKQIQLNKLNAKIEKLISQNGNSNTLKIDLKNIVNQFGNLKIRPINKLIKETTEQFKLDEKINKLVINKKITKEQAIKNIKNNTENRKIKLLENKLHEFTPKKLNKFNDEKHNKLMKKINKLNDEIIPESKEFLITLTIYKIGTSRNSNSNIEYKGDTYQLSSNVLKSFNVDLTKNLYNHNDIEYISKSEISILLDIHLHKNKNGVKNENNEAYIYIMHILSTDSNLINFEITDLHRTISKNNNTNIS